MAKSIGNENRCAIAIDGCRAIGSTEIDTDDRS